MVPIGVRIPRFRQIDTGNLRGLRGCSRRAVCRRKVADGDGTKPGGNERGGGLPRRETMVPYMHRKSQNEINQRVLAGSLGYYLRSGCARSSKTQKEKGVSAQRVRLSAWPELELGPSGLNIVVDRFRTPGASRFQISLPCGAPVIKGCMMRFRRTAKAWSLFSLLHTTRPKPCHWPLLRPTIPLRARRPPPSFSRLKFWARQRSVGRCRLAHFLLGSSDTYILVSYLMWCR